MKRFRDEEEEELVQAARERRQIGRQKIENSDDEEPDLEIVEEKEDGEKDAWADSLEKMEPGNFSEKLLANAAAAAEFWKEDEKLEISELGTRLEISRFLLEKETARMAMNRLTGRIPGAKKKFPGPKMSPENSEKFKKLTDACDALAALGHSDIFDIPKEDLVFPCYNFQVLRNDQPAHANEPNPILLRQEFAASGGRGDPPAGAEPKTAGDDFQRGGK